MAYPQFPGLQPPPQPAPTRNTAAWVAAAVLFTAVLTGVLLAIASNHTHHQADGALRDQAFLTVVHTDIPTYDHTPDVDLIRMGHTACGVLNSGGSLLDVVQTAVTYGGLDELDAGQFAGAAIGAYCPDMAP